MDVLTEGQNFTDRDLEFIHSHKTGALISASCEIGALLGGGTELQVQTLKSFGAKVGLAFQIVDDLLNELSTAEQLGKAAGSDRDRGRLTRPSQSRATNDSRGRPRTAERKCREKRNPAAARHSEHIARDQVADSAYQGPETGR